MRAKGIAVLFAMLCVPVLSSSATAFSFSPEDGIVGGDSDRDFVNPYCRFLGETDAYCVNDPGDLPEDQQPECSDGEDNNGLWGTDYNEEMWDGDSEFAGDPGCSSPYDDTEAAAWDTDLTASYRNGFTGSPQVSQNPTVFHTGALKLGNDLVDDATANGMDLSISRPDSASSGSADERHLLVSRSSLGDGKYSDTGLNPGDNGETNVWSDLPEGSVISDSGVVEPPVDPDDIPSSTLKGNEQTCGDGKYDSSGSGVLGSQNPSIVDGGTQPDEKSGRVECREDFGVLVNQPFHFKLSDDRTSDITITGLTENGNPKSKEITGETVFGDEGLECKSDTVEDTSDKGESEDLDVTEDYRITEENDYWEIDGDAETLTRIECTVTGDVTDGVGEARSFQADEIIRCNDYNRVNGGARKQTRSDISRPANDKAGTYTDFKAYAESGSVETVWCGYDPEGVSTVDADGPRGRGDGFVVINNTDDAGEVVGTRGTRSANGVGDSPRDTVGQMVHTKQFGGSLTLRDTNYLNPESQDWEASCPRDLKYCVKYLDYYTSSQESVWQGDSNIGNAVRATATSTMSPDRSYSVCKFINLVHYNQVSGDDRELLDCDYEASRDEGSGDMSPLPESCGDVPNEHLIAGEGNQVDFGSLSKRLYQSQACVSYGSDTADIDTAGNEGEVTESACVMDGAAYAEGTTLDVADSGQEIERNQASPDLEVCLDPNDSATPDTTADRVEWDNARNRQDSRDFGGEWYDPDNEKVREYVDSTFDQSDYPQNPVSRVETFVRTNPNPDHPEYNPTGGETGLTLEDDCGSDRFTTGLRCEDETSKSNTDNLFYTFFDNIIDR